MQILKEHTIAALMLVALACGDDDVMTPMGDASVGDAGADDAGGPAPTEDSGSPMLCGERECAMGEVCVFGSCFVGCEGNDDCSGAELCFSGRCASSVCDGISCEGGEVCSGGACRTECESDGDCGGARCLAGACFELPNVGPEVNAGVDRSVAEATEVTVVGSAVDPDGSIAATVWTQLSGPAVVLIEDGATVSFVAPGVDVAEDIELELRAFDELGAEDADTVTITVEPVVGPPVADAGPDFESNHDIVVELHGSAMDDGPIASWAWTQVSGPSVALLGADRPDASFEAPVVGSATGLTFMLTVTAADGAMDSDEVVVTLLPLNTPPVVSAGNDQVVSEDDSVVLSGAAMDPNLTSPSVSPTWTQIAGSMVSLVGADSLTPTFDAPTVDCIETLAFELSVTDAGGSTITDEVEITVLSSDATIEPDTLLDLEDATGGGFTPTGEWEHGAPTSGPHSPHSGANVWATVLAGEASASMTSHLTMRPIDLRDANDPVLSFRMWVRAGFGADGLSVEINGGDGWGSIPGRVRRPYEVDGLRWNNTRGPLYELVDVDLAELAGGYACARFAFTGDATLGAGVGAYVDDVGLHSESSDPDGDGLVGIRTEVEMFGSDPFLADSDSDGVDDGTEVQTDGTNPANPADYEGALVWTTGTEEDFEAGSGGFAPHPGFQWEHGGPDSGPGVAHSGGSVWATNLDGSYTSNAVDYLYLPVMNLADATDPTLALFIWSVPGLVEAHGANVQVRAGDSVWTTVEAQHTPYTNTNLGQEVWNDVTGETSSPDAPYKLTALSLADWAGQERVELRIGFYAHGGRVNAGAYLDDVVLYDESDDPDGDGLPGVLSELLTHGTWPLRADTDGDGVNDGMEVMDGTNPLNPAVFSGAPTLGSELYEDFENPSGGGFATDGSLWEHGFPSSGPGAPYSGSFVWGTSLTGHAPSGAREYLYLPEVDLSGATDPTLSLRFWTASGLVEPDGTNVQVLTDSGWQVLAMQVQPYNTTPTGSQSVWVEFREWTFAAGSLAAFAGEQVQIRISWLDPNGGRTGLGTYIDDVAITEETSDPDEDGIAGVISEVMSIGTDPFVSDTDGDGAADGADAAPLDPSVQ